MCGKGQYQEHRYSIDYTFKHKKHENERGLVGGLDQNLCDFTKWNKPVNFVRSGKCSREFGEN